jgi:hypothetical protein
MNSLYSGVGSDKMALSPLGASCWVHGSVCVGLGLYFRMFDKFRPGRGPVTGSSTETRALASGSPSGIKSGIRSVVVLLKEGSAVDTATLAEVVNMELGSGGETICRGSGVGCQNDDFLMPVTIIKGRWVGSLTSCWTLHQKQRQGHILSMLRSSMMALRTVDVLACCCCLAVDSE